MKSTKTLNKKECRLYVDMDGVITDFIKKYKETTGIDPSEHTSSKKSFWDPIDKAGYDYWAEMEWMPDGKQLWSYIKKYIPEMLSSPSRQNSSRVGKTDWVKRELPGTRLILRSSKHKKEFAEPNSILIDDRVSNIDDWNESGGIGILHTSTENTIKELKKLGL